MLAGSSLVAQTQRVPAETRFAKTPGGQVLGSLTAGTSVTTGKTDGDAIEVTLDGWIITSSLDPTKRDGFDLLVTQRPTENLRDAPNGPVIARLSVGVLLNKVETRGGWTRVRRTAWISRRALAAGALPPAASGPAGSSPSDRVLVARSTALAIVAGGAGVGTLDSGASARVLGRAGDWTRIQVDGWVKDSDLLRTNDGVLIGVSQAEVKANPKSFVGQVVEWRVQFVAIQKADELRPEMPLGQPYLLTRGPLPEPGFVYVIVPADKLESFQALNALQELTIRARIKAATSKFLPTPVVELLEVVKESGD